VDSVNDIPELLGTVFHFCSKEKTRGRNNKAIVLLETLTGKKTVEKYSGCLDGDVGELQALPHSIDKSACFLAVTFLLRC
jgi:hypothetical protein